MSCGISQAGFEIKAPRLENWLKNNSNGQMTYMENHFDKRLNPTLLVDGAKSVVSLLLNYQNNFKIRIHLKYQNMLMVQITIL
jgi:epoxyqueuosine reductase